jgi:hypothetical protein
MYRAGIACVAQRLVTTQIGWTMEHFKVLFFLVAQDVPAAKHRNLNCRIVNAIA